MPKLNKTQAKKTAAAESSSFGPLDPGIYTGRLSSVEAKDGAKGTYWSWEFDEIETRDGDKVPGRLWVNTSLSDSASWKLKEMFDAFGYSTDSDTDEMVGERIKLQVSQRVIESGARAGELGNNVDRCMPLDDDDDGGDADDEEVF